MGIANQFSEQLIYSLHGHASQCENCCDVLLNLFVCVAFFCSRIIAAMQHSPIHSGALWHKDVLSEKWCLLWVFSALAYRTMRTHWEWEMVLNCNSRWCNISFFAVEGVNLIDASILNSRLTYCAVQPVDSFQIIVLLILTQPFIIICNQPTTVWCSAIPYLMLFMLICYIHHMSTGLQKKTPGGCHSFRTWLDICGIAMIENISTMGLGGGWGWVDQNEWQPTERKMDLSAIGATH